MGKVRSGLRRKEWLKDQNLEIIGKRIVQVEDLRVGNKGQFFQGRILEIEILIIFRFGFRFGYCLMLKFLEVCFIG